MTHFDVTTRDVRATGLFTQAQERLAAWYRPGSGKPADFVDLSISPDGRQIAAAAVLADKLEGLPGQRICLIDAATGAIEMISSSERIDRLPKWSPDGDRLLFVSDRDAPYDFQVQILDLSTRIETPVRLKDLWVEYAQWSPGGEYILIAAAGRGVDLSGAQGGIPSPLASSDEVPAWAPEIEAGHDESEWRSLWLYKVADSSLKRISPDGVTVWEACWCGSDSLLFVASDGPAEEDWYTADLRRLDLATGAVHSIYRPRDQLGWPCASPSGDRIAVVEAVCSDRTIVAGNLLVSSDGGQSFAVVDSADVDVTSTAWQSEDHLLYAGHRSFESVLALLDPDTGASQTIWSDDRLTFGGARFPEAVPGPRPGQAALLVEGHFKRPELFLVDRDEARSLIKLGEEPFVDACEALGTAHEQRWTSEDGLEIHGWVLEPKGERPNATILDIHGGPVWLWRPRFVGRPGYPALLLARGYTVFQPNVRGSSGRGQDYARHVFGDMGGADTHDYLTGVDQLVADGLADPARLGVTGGSYGGFMSSWLITQDSRFSAAVPIAPVTDWVSEHLTSHIGHFCEMFLADDMTNPVGKYHSRSPVFFTEQVNTPVLVVCGAIDRNTPPVQALEFHRALRMNGKQSALLTYPGEGHGIRKMPAVIDFTARLVGWFEQHMPPGAPRSRGDRS
ncbi:S9 family peptidase [Sphingopyxis granuli]|uniref:S9 family peptidase n=1 Tax=Sphingopyxis granuli TaxID=267128 RepID=UPI00301D5B3D